MTFRRFFLGIGCLFLVLSSSADDKVAPLTLKDGRVFAEWKITGETSDSVYIRHTKGMAKVLKRVLPEPLRAEYPIDATLAKEERAKEAKEAKEKQAREASARAREAANPPVARQAARAESETENRAARELNIKQRVFAAAKARANQYFEYEYEPTSTNRILSFDVSIDADEPEPWAGIPGRYTVKGKGYLKFYQRYSGFERATREFRVDVDVTDFAAKAVQFQLR